MGDVFCFKLMGSFWLPDASRTLKHKTMIVHDSDDLLTTYARFATDVQITFECVLQVQG